MDIKIDPKLLRINRMLCEIDNIYQKMLSTINMQESVYLTFFAILELGEGCLQKDIANNICATKQTINTAIKKLEKDGYITLEKAEQYPNKHIYLTEDGRKIIKEKILPIIELENRIVEKMSEEDFLNLTNSYQKYIDSYAQNVIKFIEETSC